MGSVGFVVAVLGIGYLLDHLPIGSLLWMTAAVLFGIVVCAFFLPEASRPVAHVEASGLSTVLARREVRTLFGACFLMSAAHGALYVFYSIYLVENGYDKSLVGWMWTLGVVAEIGVFLFMPRLMQAFTIRAILLFSFACAVLRFAMIGRLGWGHWRCWFLPSFCMVLPSAPITAPPLQRCTRGFRAFASEGQALYGSISFGAGGMVGD